MQYSSRKPTSSCYELCTRKARICPFLGFPSPCSLHLQQLLIIHTSSCAITVLASLKGSVSQIARMYLTTLAGYCLKQYWLCVDIISLKMRESIRTGLSILSQFFLLKNFWLAFNLLLSVTG